MKMSIEWHEKCLDSTSKSLDKRLNELLNIQNKLSKDINDFNFYKKQINAAKKKNRDGFDSERFMHTLKK
jgi:hypothetical protein